MTDLVTPDDVVADLDGRLGTVLSVSEAAVRLQIHDGPSIDLARERIERDGAGALRTDVSFADLQTYRFQEVEERLTVRKEVRETGRVSVRTVTDEVAVPVDADGWRDTVTVERVPVGRDVDGVQPTRTEGDVTIIPVYEEVLVVRTQLVLREEIRLTRRRETVPGPESVSVRRQRVEVERDAGLDEEASHVD